MRIAVISDIHGNRLALEAVLEDIAAEGVDLTVNLGDTVSGPMEPSWTCDILIDLELPTVAGNHDRWLTDKLAKDMSRVDRFSVSQLDRQHITWLTGLPATLDMLGEIFLCHGTPRSDTDPWLDGWPENRRTTMPDEAAVTSLAEGFDFPVLLCGHTHVPRSVRLGDGRLIVNPGSVGLQFNHGSPDARYATVERRNGKWVSALRTVQYDHVGAARQATANGFPNWDKALTSGWVGHEGLF